MSGPSNLEVLRTSPTVKESKGQVTEVIGTSFMVNKNLSGRPRYKK